MPRTSLPFDGLYPDEPDERAAIVAWLRGPAMTGPGNELSRAAEKMARNYIAQERVGSSASMNGADEYFALTLAGLIADAIERGDHLTPETV